MNMQRNHGRRKSRLKPTKQEKFVALSRTVKAVQESVANGSANGNHDDTNTLRLDLEAAHAQAILQSQRIAELETELAALKTAPIECRILIDVKAPELAMHRNSGWQVKHYEFVDNDRSLPVLAVVMERPVVVADVSRQEEASVQPESPAPSNFDTTQKVEVVFDDMLLDESEPVAQPELVPSMSVTGITIEPASQPQPSLLEKLKAEAPILAAIGEHGVEAVKAAMDNEVLNAGLQGYNNAMRMLNLPIEPKRFESRLLSDGNVNPDTITPEILVVEAMLP